MVLDEVQIDELEATEEVESKVKTKTIYVGKHRFIVSIDTDVEEFLKERFPYGY